MSSAFRIGDYANALSYGYELHGTLANLKWALQQSPLDVPKYRFSDDFQTYSILEYAVKCGDAGAIMTLFQLGAKGSLERIVHFYIEDLVEAVPPNLEVLNVLLDELSQDAISGESDGILHVLLEHALEQMSDYKCMHWDVIIILLERGMCSKSAYDPASVIQAFSKRVPLGCSSPDIQAEVKRLCHLVGYLALERKYHPHVRSGLTVAEFTSLVPSFMELMHQGAFSAQSIPFAFDVRRNLSFLSKRMDRMAFTEIITQECPEEFERVVQKQQEDFFQAITGHYKKFEVASLYHVYFKSLVKTGEFRDCFEESAIKSAVSTLQNAKSKDALRLMVQLKKMELLPQELNW